MPPLPTWATTPSALANSAQPTCTTIFDSISKWSTAIGVVTAHAKHYFYAQGDNPSGEALIAMKSPLTRKAARLQATLHCVERELAGYIMSMMTRPTSIAYEDVETVQANKQGADCVDVEAVGDAVG